MPLWLDAAGAGDSQPEGGGCLYYRGWMSEVTVFWCVLEVRNESRPIFIEKWDVSLFS